LNTQIFVPQALLDAALDEGRLDLDGEHLVVDHDLRFETDEAFRVLREVVTGQDPHSLCGQVRTTKSLPDIDAELLGHSLLVNESAYDVVPGMLLTLSDSNDSISPSVTLAAMESLQKLAPEAPPSEA
jgi:hypothetical protein